MFWRPYAASQLNVIVVGVDCACAAGVANMDAASARAAAPARLLSFDLMVVSVCFGLSNVVARRIRAR